MHNRTDQLDFPVQLSGCIASRTLKESTNGRVAAVFRSSFYVETDAGFVCIGNESLEPSPLSLVTKAPAGTDWSASGLRRNAKIHLSREAISVGNRFLFLLCGAVGWSPAPIPKSWNIIDLERGLNSFRDASLSHLPEEGLGRFLMPGFSPEADEAVSRTAQIPIAKAQRWLVAAMWCPNKGGQDLRWVYPLIGLGPGLTPSGDDFIGGVMIALHSLGEAGACERLWVQAHRCAKQASNPISRVHLCAASQGQAGAGVHRALAAIMEGQEQAICESLAGIGRIGHTSGWDAMAGVVITFDAWLRAHRH